MTERERVKSTVDQMGLVSHGGNTADCNTPGALSSTVEGRSTDRSAELERFSSNCPWLVWVLYFP